MRPILLVDANYLCHRARWTTGDLSYKGRKTGIVFGFLNQVHQLATEIAPSNVVFVWDSQQSLRKERFPFYKEHRRSEPDPEAALHYAQFNDLRENILPQMGFVNNFRQEGYEADDVIATICQTAIFPSIIASSDEDLLQLLSHDTSMYNLGKKSMVTYRDFRKEKGIHPKRWVEVKKIAGCPTDSVPGVPGVGEKTAILYLRGKLKPGSKKIADIEANTELIERNDWLVRLPLPGTECPEVKQNQFRKDVLVRVCKEYGFSKFTNNAGFLDDWEVYFGG